MKALLLVSAGVAAAILIPSQAQTQSAAAANPKFEVASIRRVIDCGSGRGGVSSSPGRLTVKCTTVEGLIRGTLRYPDALNYNSNFLYISIEGGPAWIKSDLYEINAEADGNASREMMSGPMQQALLADRFKLRTHRETREVPVYALTLAKGGFKLHPLEAGTCPPTTSPAEMVALLQAGKALPKFCGSGRWGGKRPSLMTADFIGNSVDEFSSALGRALDRPVINKTGIAGIFDFHMEFSPDQSTPAFLSGGALRGDTPSSNPPPAVLTDDPSGPSIFTAIQEQLGLKLEPTKGPGEFLVIDSVDRPSQD